MRQRFGFFSITIAYNLDIFSKLLLILFSFSMIVILSRKSEIRALTLSILKILRPKESIKSDLYPPPPNLFYLRGVIDYYLSRASSTLQTAPPQQIHITPDQPHTTPTPHPHHPQTNLIPLRLI